MKIELLIKKKVSKYFYSILILKILSAMCHLMYYLFLDNKSAFFYLLRNNFLVSIVDAKKKKKLDSTHHVNDYEKESRLI